MNKLKSLREHLLTKHDGWSIDPKHLVTTVNGGEIISAPEGENLNYEWKFNANILILKFSGDANQLFFWVLRWLSVNQPNHDEKAFEFDTDFINDQSTDIALVVPLSQIIVVDSTAEGFVLLPDGEPDMKTELLPAENWTLNTNDAAMMQWVNGGG